MAFLLSSREIAIGSVVPRFAGLGARQRRCGGLANELAQIVWAVQHGGENFSRKAFKFPPMATRNQGCASRTER